MMVFVRVSPRTRKEPWIDAPADGTAHTRLDLACDGLDTIATVELNGAEIGRAANMHHPHRFDVREHAASGLAATQLDACLSKLLRHFW